MLFTRKIKETAVPLEKAIDGKLKIGDRFTTTYTGKYRLSDSNSDKHYMNDNIVNICIDKDTILSIAGMSTIAAEKKGNVYLNYKGIIKLFDRYLKAECPIKYDMKSARILDYSTIVASKYFSLNEKFVDNYSILTYMVDKEFASKETLIDKPNVSSIGVYESGKIRKANKNKPYSIGIVWRIDK